MATSADIGSTTTYEIHDPDVSPNYVVLGEVVSIDLGGDESDLIDVTHMASPDNRREFIGGLIDGGEISVELNFVPNNATHQLLRARLTAGDTQNHRITFPGGETVTVGCIVRSISATVPVGDKMSLTFTAKQTGTATWTS